MFRLPIKRIAPRLWSKNEARTAPNVLITIPTWNEELVIGKTLETLTERAPGLLPDCRIIVEVADNGSTDRTREMVKEVIASLARNQTANQTSPNPSFVRRGQSILPLTKGEQEGVGCGIEIHLLELHEKGKGMAIRRSWERHLNDCDVLVFTDADLAADISALPSLIRPILDHEADLVCGSRFVPGSKVERKIMREAASRLFNLLQKLILNLPVKDAQCGFKAISANAAKELLPIATEGTWLFDSELLALAVKKGYRIKEIPVSWVENRDPRRQSAVRLWKHGWGFLLGLARIRHRV